VTPATDLLRRFVNMQIRDVRDVPGGVLLELNAPAGQGRRRILLRGLTDARELVDHPYDVRDVDQAQADIGDDVYERQRYDERDIDVEPDRPRTRPESPL